MPFIRLVFLRILRAAISIASLIITAKFIGVSTSRDAWILALSVIGILSVFLFNPTLEIFRSKAIHIRSELSAEEVDIAISSYITFSLFVALLAILCLAVMPNLFATVVGAQATPQLFDETSRFLRWGAIYVLLTQLTNGWSSILNSENHYAGPEIVGIVAAMLNVVVLLAMVRHFGADALLWATLVSSAVQVVSLSLLLKRYNKTIFITSKLNLGYAWRFVAPALPLYFAFGAGQLALIVEKNLLVRAGTGAVSIYDYARKFVDVPFGVITTTAASLVGPTLSRFGVQQDERQFVHAALGNLKAFILILLPVTVTFSLGGSTLIHIFFANSASVSEADMDSISELLAVLGWGLLGVAVYAVASQTLIARGRISHYAKLGLLTQVLYILISWLLFSKFGPVAIAAGWGISYAVTGLLMQLYAKIPFDTTLLVTAKAMSWHLFIAILYRVGKHFLPITLQLSALGVLFCASCGFSLLLIHRDAKGA